MAGSTDDKRTSRICRSFGPIAADHVMASPQLPRWIITLHIPDSMTSPQAFVGFLLCHGGVPVIRQLPRRARKHDRWVINGVETPSKGRYPRSPKWPFQISRCRTGHGVAGHRGRRLVKEAHGKLRILEVRSVRSFSSQAGRLVASIWKMPESVWPPTVFLSARKNTDLGPLSGFSDVWA